MGKMTCIEDLGQPDSYEEAMTRIESLTESLKKVNNIIIHSKPTNKMGIMRNIEDFVPANPMVCGKEVEFTQTAINPINQMNSEKTYTPKEQVENWVSDFITTLGVNRKTAIKATEMVILSNIHKYRALVEGLPKEQSELFKVLVDSELMKLYEVRILV
jgi:hypothetical protein